MKLTPTKKPAIKRAASRSDTSWNYCLVEAAGIEPASANTPPKGATCLVCLLCLTFFYPTDRVEKRDSGKVLTAPSQTYFTAIPYI